MKKAILWDLDGVLVRTENLYFFATREVLRELDIELDRCAYHRLFLRQSLDPLRLALRERNLDYSYFFHLDRRRLELYLALLETEPIAVEGVSETIHRLASKYVMGIVTGSKRDQVHVIAKRTDFFHLFDFIITRDDVTASKPSAEPYLHAIRRASVPCTECVAIEDSERGLISAKAAGLECWVIPNTLTKISDFTSADRVITNVKDVESFL